VNELNPAFPHVPSLRSRLRLVFVAVAMAVIAASPGAALAAPGYDTAGAPLATAQNVDYLGPETAASLDLGFPVLVPSWVPGPFGGTPAVNSGGGYYSLYWMNAGGEPTFLQVTGQVGGALPAGSPYDLNNQLFINASVQGYGAIHDVTPAYDAVWWIAGGVLYKVESRNSSTDSLTLANSLIPLVPPAAPEPEPEPTSPPVSEPEPELPDQGGDLGGGTTSPPATEVGADSRTVSGTDEQAVTLVDDEPDSGNDAIGSDDTADDAGAQGSDGAAEAGNDDGGEAVEEAVAASDGTGGVSFASDGTGGAQNLIVGGDGTGGTVTVIVPRERESTP